MGDEFNKWVQKKIKSKGWNKEELARRSGLNSGTISNVLKGKRQPGTKFYVGMARAFDVSLAAIERLGREGIEPDSLSMDDDLTLKELMALTKELTPKQRLEALKYLIYLRRTGGDEPDD